MIRKARAQNTSVPPSDCLNPEGVFIFGKICPRNTRKDAKKKKNMVEILYRDESYKIIGACFEVYKQKGCGFTEPVYQECLEIEFSMQGIPFFSQLELELEYKGRPLAQTFKPDFICYEKIIVEIKALSNLIDVHRAQVLNYLNATKFDLALLVNFGQYPKLEHERIVNNKRRAEQRSIRDEINSWGIEEI
jgi:GxxExxY protein